MRKSGQTEKIRYVRYRSEHLAEHLRESLARRQLIEPLPTLRAWSSQLGVSSGTLQAALKILKREGWIQSRPRHGFSIARRLVRRRPEPSAPLIRWILVDQPRDNAVLTEVLGRLSHKLSAHRIGISLELCGSERLAEVRREGERPREMLLLSTSRHEHQKVLAGFRNVLLFSPPAEGIRLPYIDLDVAAVFRHAVFTLCRRGFDRVNLVNTQTRYNEPGRRREFERRFQQIGSQAPRPVRCEITWLPEELDGQQREAQRVAARVVGRHGFITNAPVLPGLLMMALMQRGLKIPKDIEVVGVNCPPSQALTVPPMIHYPYPVEPFCKAVLQGALHYFDQGVLPRMHKLIPLAMVSPS